jgi:hypothetical protein
MLKQLFKISRRVFILQKAYSLVNILGLGYHAISVALVNPARTLKTE